MPMLPNGRQDAFGLLPLNDSPSDAFNIVKVHTFLTIDYAKDLCLFAVKIIELVVMSLKANEVFK